VCRRLACVHKSSSKRVCVVNECVCVITEMCVCHQTNGVCSPRRSLKLTNTHSKVDKYTQYLWYLKKGGSVSLRVNEMEFDCTVGGGGSLS